MHVEGRRGERGGREIKECVCLNFLTFEFEFDNLLQPIVVSLLTWAIYQEIITQRQLSGAGLIIGGLVIVTYQKYQENKTLDVSKTIYAIHPLITLYNLFFFMLNVIERERERECMCLFVCVYMCVCVCVCVCEGV
jgi:hypothetical protein